MIKTLSAIGNSLGLIIERPILELLRIDKDTELEVRTDGDALIIRPLRKEKLERVHEATHRLMDKHDKLLDKLSK